MKEKVILYTIDCPLCIELESLLNAAEIEYTKNTSVEDMLNLGLKNAPALQVGLDILDYSKAEDWIKQFGKETE